MRKAGRVTAGMLDAVGRAVRPGVTTEELDAVAADFLRSQGAKPSFLGFEGYPKTICTSVNEEVVHGIPGPRALHEGDIVSVDAGAIVDGYQGDAARTFAVGRIDPQAQKLIEVTEKAMYIGIHQAKPGVHLGDIGYAIQQYVEAQGFGVVREYVGHGIGTEMHEDPPVPNYGRPGRGLRLRSGMCICIEPMVTAGDPAVRLLADGWTAVTQDGSWAAHFEHSLAILPEGAEILTQLS